MRQFNYLEELFRNKIKLKTELVVNNEECLRPIADRAMRETPKRVPARALCTGFHRALAGEAIRMQCVKWQTLNINANDDQHYRSLILG